MRSRIGIVVLAILVLSGYTRCGVPAPPANPVMVATTPAQACLRNDWARINGNRMENVNTGDVITSREYRRIPDIELDLEPGRCFALPDCAGADPLALGHFRDSGFNFVDPFPGHLDDAGTSRGEMRGGGFTYLFTDSAGEAERINQRLFLSEMFDGTGPGDQLVLCARDDATPTATSLRGWVIVGQTDEDRQLNGIGSQNGHAAIRYAIDVLDGSPVPPLSVELNDRGIGYTVTPDAPVTAIATVNGAAADSTLSCSWAANDSGILVIADPQDIDNPNVCTASLSLDPVELPENGAMLGFGVLVEEFDANGDWVDSARDSSVVIANVLIASDPVIDLATPVTLNTGTGRERIVSAEVSGIGNDASRVACAWSAPQLQMLPIEGVTPDVAGRYPAEETATGTYLCEARARLPEDYLPLNGDSFNFTAEAFAIDETGAAIASSGPANGTLFVATNQFPVSAILFTPELNWDQGGLRPRYDDHISSALAVAGDAPIARLRASIRGCDIGWVSSCDPIDVTLAAPATTATLDLPGIAGSEGGRQVTVDVTIEGEDGSAAQQSVSRDFWPPDSGLGIACTRSYDADGRLELSIELVDEGLPTNPSPSPLRPYLLSELFDVRYYIFQRGPLGWMPDETGSFLGTFVYAPQAIDVFDDGNYQIIVVGQLGFVEPIQAATLTFDTTGSGPDLCPIAP